MFPLIFQKCLNASVKMLCVFLLWTQTERGSLYQNLTFLKQVTAIYHNIFYIYHNVFFYIYI